MHRINLHFFRFSLSFLRLFLGIFIKFFGYLDDFLTQLPFQPSVFPVCTGMLRLFSRKNSCTAALQSGYSLHLWNGTGCEKRSAAYKNQPFLCQSEWFYGLVKDAGRYKMCLLPAYLIYQKGQESGRVPAR
jgi:hypothetical protein